MKDMFEKASAEKASRPEVKDLERSFIEILLHIAVVVLVITYWYEAIDAYRTRRNGDTRILFTTIASMGYFFLMIPEVMHPREYNYLNKITEENARGEYVGARIFLGCVRLVGVAAFSPITLAGWSPRVVLALVSAISIPSMVAYCVFRAKRVKE